MKIMGLIFWFCLFFIGYVYAGFPLILALLARLRAVFLQVADLSRLPG